MIRIAIANLGLLLLQIKREQGSNEKGSNDLLQKAILTNAVLALLLLIPDRNDLLPEFSEHADVRLWSNLGVEK